MSFVIYWLVLPLYFCAAVPLAEFKSESGAYFKKHDSLRPYETTAKAIFEIYLPKFEATDPGECSGTDLQCIAEKTVYVRQMELNHMLGGTSTKFAGVRRPKRQVVAAAVIAGFLLHSIYTVIAQKMFGSDADAQNNIQTIWRSMQGEKKDFLLFKEEINLYSQNLSRAVKRNWLFDSELERQTRSHLYLTAVNQYTTRVNMGIIRCSSNLIPFEFIPSTIFITKLKEIEQRVGNFSYHLSVSPDNINEYMVLNIANCFFSQSKVYVLVNVPVFRNTWNVFELIPVPFSFQSQICILENRQTDLVAISKSEVRVLDLNSRPFCDIVQDKLCLVPSFQRPTEDSGKCVSYIYNKSPLERLGNACQIKCIRQSNITVTYLERNLVSVANGKILYVNCPKETKHIQLHSFGSLEIAMKCNCSYKVDETVIDTYGTCFDELFNPDDVSKVVPHFLLAPSLSNSNFELHDNWTQMIPILNLTRSENDNDNVVPILDFGNSVFNNQQRDILLICLTLIVFLVIISKIVSYVLFCRIFA